LIVHQHRDRLINLNLLFIAIIAGAYVVQIAWGVLTVLFPVLILLLIAMLVAFLLGGPVSRLQALGMPRALAVMLVYLVLLSLIFGLGSLLVKPLANQISALSTLLGSAKGRHDLQVWVKNTNHFFQQHNIPLSLDKIQSQGITYAQQAGTKVLGSTLDVVLNVSHVVIDIVAVIVISLYLLIDGPRLHHNILRIIPERQRHTVLFIEVTVRSVVGSYVRGQLILAIIIGLMAGIGSTILDLRYPLVIGMLAGFFELVPMLGPILGAAPAIGIAAFQSWQLVIATIIMFILIQQLEAHVIAPRIMGHAVGVHPIVAIMAVLLGAELDGILGALVAVPVAGIIYVIAQAAYSQITGQQQTVTVVTRRSFYSRWLKHLRRARPAAESESFDDAETVTVEAPSNQLAPIVHERDVLAEQFELAEKMAGRAREQVPDRGE
jgi:predicted PurR-regulated permease PerM